MTRTPHRHGLRHLSVGLLAVLVLCGLLAAPSAAETPAAGGETAFDPEAPSDPGEPKGPPVAEPRIVGGTQAPAGAWPHQVGILLRNEPSNYHAQFCGGTLIARSWVLTAAHCVRDQGWNLSPGQVDVLVGTQSLVSGGTRIQAAEFRIHPSWDPDVFWNDIALIRLRTPAPQSFTSFQTYTAQGVSPVAGTAVTTTGWGTMAYGTENYPTELRQATVDVSTPAACQSAYGSFYQQSTMVCAAAVGRDACQGDSGGPLVEDRGGSWVQVGIVSTGYRCAEPGYPGVYTRVAAFSTWISQQIRYGAHPDAPAFVRRQYRDAYDRQPTNVELFTGVAALNDGQAPEAFAAGVLSQGAFDRSTGAIVRLYQAVFLRRPDTGGMAYWWREINRGVGLRRIADFMVASAEFQTRYGSLSTGAFVDLVYQNVLGRAPDAAGRAFWIGQIDSGARTRGGVMIGFSESPEYVAQLGTQVRIIGSWFALLRRVPAVADIDFWSTRTHQALVTTLVGSWEYANRF